LPALWLALIPRPDQELKENDPPHDFELTINTLSGAVNSVYRQGLSEGFERFRTIAFEYHDDELARSIDV
jgi:hypothetical protein